MGLVQPEIGLIFWMTISFLLVLFLLKKFAWKPILKLIKDRESSITDALEAAEKAKDEMKSLQADNEKILQKAREERELLLKEANEVKTKIIQDAKSAANVEADKIISAAKRQIESEKASAINQIKEQVVNLSVEIAEKILKQNLSDDKSQKDLASRLINDIELN